MPDSYVYILASERNGTLYTGVTSDIIKRIYEHKNAIKSGFASRYNVSMLVFYEIHGSIESAIQHEKQIKAGSRKKKLKLIEEKNPEWVDLYSSLF